MYEILPVLNIIDSESNKILLQNMIEYNSLILLLNYDNLTLSAHTWYWFFICTYTDSEFYTTSNEHPTSLEALSVLNSTKTRMKYLTFSASAQFVESTEGTINAHCYSDT